MGNKGVYRCGHTQWNTKNTTARKGRFCFYSLTLKNMTEEQTEDDEKMTVYNCQSCGNCLFSDGAIAENWKIHPPQCCGNFMVKEEEE